MINRRLQTRRSAFVLLAAIYPGFVCLGLPDGTLGVAWPPLATELRGGLVIALLGAGGFVDARTPALAATALVLLGLGYAPVYPGLMHEVPRRFSPETAQTVVGRQSGAAYLGMAVVPALLGLAAGRSLEAIPVAILAGIALLFAGVRWLDRLTR